MPNLSLWTSLVKCNKIGLNEIAYVKFLEDWLAHSGIQHTYIYFFPLPLIYFTFKWHKTLHLCKMKSKGFLYKIICLIIIFIYVTCFINVFATWCSFSQLTLICKCAAIHLYLYVEHDELCYRQWGYHEAIIDCIFSFQYQVFIRTLSQFLHFNCSTLLPLPNSLFIHFEFLTHYEEFNKNPRLSQSLDLDQMSYM